MKIRSAAQSVALILVLFIALNPHAASARQRNSDDKSAAPSSDRAPSASAENAGSAKTPSVEDRVRALEQLIDQQQREIQALRGIIEKRNLDNTAPRPGEPASGRAAVAA